MAIVLMSAPCIVAIPVADGGRRLRDVRGALLVDDRRAGTTGASAHLRRDGLGRLAHAQPFLSDETRAVNPAWAQNQVHDVPPPESAPHSVPASTSLWGAGGVELGVTAGVNTNPEESASTCCVHVALISSLTRMNRAALAAALSAAGLVNYVTECRIGATATCAGG